MVPSSHDFKLKVERVKCLMPHSLVVGVSKHCCHCAVSVEGGRRVHSPAVTDREAMADVDEALLRARSLKPRDLIHVPEILRSLGSGIQVMHVMSS